jgi:hypothetical protein
MINGWHLAVVAGRPDEYLREIAMEEIEYTKLENDGIFPILALVL